MWFIYSNMDKQSFFRFRAKFSAPTVIDKLYSQIPLTNPCSVKHHGQYEPPRQSDESPHYQLLGRRELDSSNREDDGCSEEHRNETTCRYWGSLRNVSFQERQGCICTANSVR